MNYREKLEEWYSTQRPPMFNGKFYTYWKNRMEIFIKVENYQVWRVIESGDFELTKTNEKTRLGSHEHNRIMGCKSAKKIWDLLEVTHEGTNEVKHSKIDLLMSKYERFEMIPKKTIEEMFTRYNDIINELGSFGRHIPIDEQARKVLRSLLQDEHRRSKVTALQETKDFTKFNMEQLAESLMTHELHLGTNAESSKCKSLALKAHETDDSEVDEDEMDAAKRIEGLGYKKKFQKEKKYVDLPSSIICYFCGKIGHKQNKCPKKDKSTLKNVNHVKQLWVKKPDSISVVPMRGNNMWYLDNSCSKHMTGDKSRFLSLNAYYGGIVTFGDNMKGNSISFTSNLCRIINNDTGNIILEGTPKGNNYIVDLNEVPNSILTYLSVIEDDPLLWHKILGHTSFSLLYKLRYKELVEGLSFIKFLKDKVCHACVRGKQTRISFESKNMVSTKRPLELIHMDLCGLMRI
ncbi:uncharacterized protein LOC110691287 [Chenopodium quinoa]|uniref:uncharacterized protein LOC110691287 n=1 Tax=Chenopodium quinoa TaxID=63459 RepID=UPI000B78DB05|nr:uncharacterized protein LOC110691287 [Chenopodium quinoa]